MTDLPPPTNPLETVDAASLVLLFDMDPATIERPQLDSLIGELRRRADASKAEAARKEAAPKATAKRKKAGTNPVLSPADAALADKPIEEITLDDLDI